MSEHVIESAAPLPLAGSLWARAASWLAVDRRVLRDTAVIAVVGLGAIFGLATCSTLDAGPAFTYSVEDGHDHITPQQLGDLLTTAPGTVVLVDLRPRDEFETWHLPGSLNLDLPTLLGPKGKAGLDAAEGKTLVLVSNGMVHPAQAWVGLTQRGYTNARALEGGLTDFKREVLTPPSLRGPMAQQRAEEEAARFHAMQAWLNAGG